MAAVPCHVVYLTPMPVNSAGQVVDKNDPSTTLGDMKSTSTEVRVVARANVPSSANNPSIEAYLQLEAAGGYTLGHLSQTMIVTYVQ